MSENFQIDLFGQIVESNSSDKKSSRNKKNGPIKVKWSFSRRNTLETCLRKYYYQYYASKLEPTGTKDFKSIRFLKSLSSQHLVAGKVIHNLVKLYLKKAQTGPEFTIEWLRQSAKQKIEQSIEYSKSVLAGKEKQYQFPPFLLMEVFNEDPNASTIYETVEQKVLIALENFMESNLFEEFRAAGKVLGSHVEKKFSLQLNDRVTVTGETDLAYQRNGEFVIVDWKTGKKDDGEDSMQLLTYTWWAIEQAGADKNSIKIFKAYLNEDVKKEFSLSDHEIFRNKLAIRQSAESMLEMAQFGIAGDEFAFTPCRQPKICANCQFQKICK